MKIVEDNFIYRLKCKDPKALEYAFDRYCDYVYRIVFSVFGSERYSTYMDECINDIFMCLWNNADKFDENKGSFKCWFKAVARYKAINYKKKITRNTNTEYMENCIFESSQQVENLVISEENKKEIIEAIKELKGLDREIFIKRYLIQEDIVDIADSLGVKRSVVDNRLSRGRKILRKRLEILQRGGCINE